MSLADINPTIVAAGITVGGTAVVAAVGAGVKAARRHLDRRTSAKDARAAADAAVRTAAAALVDALRAPDSFGRNVDVAVAEAVAAAQEIGGGDPLHRCAQQLAAAARGRSLPDAERAARALGV